MAGVIWGNSAIVLSKFLLVLLLTLLLLRIWDVDHVVQVHQMDVKATVVAAQVAVIV
jgi:hypothetical protein